MRPFVDRVLHTWAEPPPGGTATDTRSPQRSRSGRRRWTILATAIFPLILAAWFADPRFTVVAGDADVPAVRLATVERLVPRALERLAPIFPGMPERPFRVVVHSTVVSLAPEIRATLHPGTPGLALLGRDEVHIVLDEVQLRPPNNLATVVAHELVHVLIDQYAGADGAEVPRWLHEGLAQHLSGDGYLGLHEEDLIYPMSVGRLPRLRSLAGDFPDDELGRQRAYAQSRSFVAFVARQVGVADLVAALRRMRPRDGYDGGFARVTGTSLAVFEDAWRNWLVNESGAQWRFLFQNCFSYVMIAGFVLLALAGIRRWNRDLAVRQKLERDDSSAAPDTIPYDTVQHDTITSDTVTSDSVPSDSAPDEAEPSGASPPGGPSLDNPPPDPAEDPAR